ncbi:MAG: hypothetical protein COB33_000005 [Thiotrichaceae bacterium]|nr:hypothetical protein [Thiotrichaceae bacterium]PCI12283.1 MAG: hypothetical protein COB71_09730 [Thiotrichales bacterium]
MTSWANHEKQATDRADVRLQKRLVKILTRLSSNTERVFPLAMRDRVTQKALSIFLTIKEWVLMKDALVIKW